VKLKRRLKELEGRKRGGTEAIINIGYRRGTNVPDERRMEANIVSSNINTIKKFLLITRYKGDWGQ
jgi:hypothetical protein